MSKLKWTCLVILVSLTLACDKKDETKEKVGEEVEAQTERPEKERPRGPISIEKLRILASQGTMLTEGAPASEDVKNAVEKALYETDSFAADGARKAKAGLTYDVRQVEKKDGKKAIDVALFGDFKLEGQDQELSAKVIVGNQAAPDSTVQDLVSKAVGKLAVQLDGQARVIAAEDAELVDFIADEDEDASARLVAVQEARDRRLTGASNTIEPLLAHEDERLQVAASAALVAFEKTDTYSKVIGVAEQFSRDRNPQLMPLLYIIGDMNTDESKTYLKTVAEAHSEPTVRKIAEEALRRGAGN